MDFAKIRLALLTVIGACWLAPASGYAQQPGKDGLFLSVRNPITDNTVTEIKRKIESAIKSKRKIDTLVFDFNYNGQPSGTSSFGSCFDLYQLIRRLQRGDPKFRTVAFVSNEVSGHTVLPVLACRHIIMSSALNDSKEYKARIGDIFRGQDQAVDKKHMLDVYGDLAKEDNLGDLVQRMMFKDLPLKKVKTRNGSDTITLYVSSSTLQSWAKEGTPFTDEHADVEPGSAQFDAMQCLDLGLCQRHYNSRAAVAAGLGLSRRSLNEDWLVDRTLNVWRIEVKETTSKGNLDSLERRIKRAVSNGANLIILQLETPGGDTTHIASLGKFLSELTDDNQQPIRTIAWLPPDVSTGAATFLAVGCSEILMAESAALGDFSYLHSNKPDDLVQRWKMLEPLVNDRGYPPLLFQATLDSNLVLYRVVSKTDPSNKGLMTESDLEIDQKSAKPQWDKQGLVAAAGQLLKISASQAREFGVAEPIDASSLQAVYNYLGVDPSRVRVARDDWLDRVAEFFREPLVNFLLVVLGIIGLILELKMPGTTVPGVIAAICFVLFFWSFSFVGEYTMLAILLFLLGIILVGIEIFVLPGFGFAGISGVLLIVGSLALAMLTSWPTTPNEWASFGVTGVKIGGSLVVAVLAAMLVAWYLPSIPYANRMVLQAPVEDTSTHDPAVPVALLGAIGVASTSLRPAGIAQFGDDFHDVIAENDFVSPGKRVQVIEIEGNRIVVKEI